jgi:hypothetical protein
MEIRSLETTFVDVEVRPQSGTGGIVPDTTDDALADRIVEDALERPRVSV